MFYTIAWRHGHIHVKVDGLGEHFEACYPGFKKKNTRHKTMHAAKLAITRDWRLYCADNAEWKRQNGEFTFNTNIKA